MQPVLGEPYLAIGLDLYDTSPPAVEAARALVQRAAAQAPEGPAVSTVMMADEFDPVAMWMWANSRPFFDRQGAPGSYPTGFGYTAQPIPGPPPAWPQPRWPGYPGR